MSSALRRAGLPDQDQPTRTVAVAFGLLPFFGVNVRLTFACVLLPRSYLSNVWRISRFAVRVKQIRKASDVNDAKTD